MDRRKGRAYKRFRVIRGLLDSLARMRHFRGHGVHSPYIYSIVRKVFMRKGLIDSSDFELYNLLKSRIDATTAIQLQNLATVCGYVKEAVDTAVGVDSELVVFTNIYPIGEIRNSLEIAKKSGTTVVIIARDGEPQFEMIARDLDENHTSTIINKRGYLLIFNNHLPKQRYTL